MNDTQLPQTPLGDIIASRQYFRPESAGGEFLAEASIGRPVTSPTSELEFVCPFRIQIKDQELIRLARGVDELHALLMALAYVEGALSVLRDNLGGQICYVGGEVGELGIELPNIKDK
jgi:hypothetical protein